MIKLAMQEMLSTHICDAHFSPGWRKVHHPSVGQDVYVADIEEMVVHLRCPPEATGVWLLRHGWSGLAEIKCEEQTVEVDLHFAEGNDLDFVVPLPKVSVGEMEVIVRCVKATDSDSTFKEVWLLGLAFSKTPLPRAKSAIVSDATRLITGDWGRFLVLSTDTDIPTAILNEGAWAPHDIKLFERYALPGSTVLDVGANFGHHSIVLSKIVGPTGRVLAIEAQHRMFQLLNANCVINASDNVLSLHMAASDRQHEVSLYPVDYSGATNFGSLGINPDVAKYSSGQIGEMVAAGCLDDVVEKFASGRIVSFIKIDVQSYEKFVLLGLMRTILKHHPALFFEISPHWMWRSGYDYRDIYRLLQRLGYRFDHFRPLDTGPDGFPNVEMESKIEWDVLALPLVAAEPCEETS